MRDCRETKIALGGLALCAIWVFGFLPFLFSGMPNLDELYKLSQIAVPIIAIFAACGVYHQIQTFKRYEALKVLEEDRVRSARALLFNNLIRQEQSSPTWWLEDDSLEQAASLVCASFDIVGLMSKGANWEFFGIEWANSICWTFEILESYIADRNPMRYRGYRELYTAAKRWRTSDPIRSAAPARDGG
jgi:hypothetical protein